ncbi:MAG TPA: LacI family DNA-binding transcriptional regulator [Solirubrobacteraceae bacterium]|nr:LacI family DNA-binding transcriptional regulator [Solirubrobacteraceae bacterium]
MRGSNNHGSVDRATMVDVARSAGVSLKTVSRVINGEPGVRPETAEKVIAAATALRYERNDLAASLRHGARSFTLGLVIEDVANPFYSAIAQAVEERARERASMLITASAREDPVRERELVTALLRRRVDALLVVPTGADHRYIHDAGFDTRTVFLDRPPARAEADTVLLENAPGARRAVEHLLASGHTRIAFVGDDVRLFTARERLSGYRKALARAGVDEDPALVAVGNSTSASAIDATAGLMALPRARRPTAILTGNNRCTVGVLRALNGKRTRLALVGFDDFELADLLGVTVVRTNPYRLGQLAVELAFDRIDGNDGKPRRLVVPAELVTRGSGEIPA